MRHELAGSTQERDTININVSLFKDRQILKIIPNDIHIWRGQFNKNNKEELTEILKSILSFYVEFEKKNFNFNKTRFGKPYLVCDNKKVNIFFNITHSENIFALIISNDKECGIDLEFCIYQDDLMDVAKSFFNQADYAYLLSLNSEERITKFYQIWITREAILKCIGIGISQYIKLPDIANYLISPSSMFSTEIENSIYTVQTFTQSDNLLGAVAVKGKINTLNFYEYE